VVPTLLYYLGCRSEGHGRVRADDIFRREFTVERPITFIPTYDR